FFFAYIAVITFATSLFVYQYYDVLEKMLFVRYQGEQLTKNNRSHQVEGCLRILRNAEPLMDVILFGEPNVRQKEGFVYVNPLGPLVYDGILISWIYYVCMLVLIFGGVVSKKYRFILWGFMLVFAQRPYYLTKAAHSRF